MDTDQLEDQLKQYDYNKKESEFLIDGFRNGFEIGYRGNRLLQRKSLNLRLECSSPEILWSKMMKEVMLKQFAGPFEQSPFKHFIQSPVGLVPKGMDKSETRLIFHLSYPRGGKSINSETPKELCSVSYKDLVHAIQLFAGW